MVPDEGVRHAADNVYECFGHWLSEEVASLANGTAAPDVEVVLASPGKLAAAVRDVLIDLQERQRSVADSRHRLLPFRSRRRSESRPIRDRAADRAVSSPGPGAGQT
jgi:hypothetical protein